MYAYKTKLIFNNNIYYFNDKMYVKKCLKKPKAPNPVSLNSFNPYGYTYYLYNLTYYVSYINVGFVGGT